VQVGETGEKPFHLAAIGGRANRSTGDRGIADSVGIGNHKFDEFHSPLIPDGMVKAAEQFLVSLGDGHGAFLPRNARAPVCS